MASILVVRPIVAHAAVPQMGVPSGLSIVEIKMTGDEFIVLQNNTDQVITNLSSYWLTAYNNVNPLAAGASSSTQQLPTASLSPGQTMQLSAEAMQTCGASVTGKLSLSFGDSGGYLQVSQLTLGSNNTLVQTPSDIVSWSSSANGVIQNMPSNTKAPRSAYYRYLNGSSYAWQLADLDIVNVCQLNIVVAGGLGSSSAVTPLTLAATSPPATILGVVQAGDTESVPQIPASDIGLNAPQISEMLPNPMGTGNDATEEFVELYNPNGKPFDLTGFVLQTGVTTVREYVFPTGTTIPPSSFKAFSAEDTKLGLSNTASLVTLVDPLGNVISAADTYTKAKDGLAWAVANGKWYWTTQPTPGVANVIKQPAIKKSKTATTKKKSTRGAGKGVKAKTSSLTAATSSGSFEDAEEEAPIHMWVLALVAGGALLYGAYEYRRDITNRMYQLGTKLGIRRTPWQAVKGRRSD